MKHLKFSYSDIMSMPTYERRFFLLTLQNEISKNIEDNHNNTGPVSTGKGRRVTKISGDALKTRINNGEIK